MFRIKSTENKMKILSHMDENSTNQLLIFNCAIDLSMEKNPLSSEKGSYDPPSQLPKINCAIVISMEKIHFSWKRNYSISSDDLVS